MSVTYCPKCGKEEIATCPICNQPVETFSRIVGYLTPLSRWGDGKRQEFRERKEFVLGERWRDAEDAV